LQTLGCNCYAMLSTHHSWKTEIVVYWF
jgi:hypothetical protein